MLDTQRCQRFGRQCTSLSASLLLLLLSFDLASTSAIRHVADIPAEAEGCICAGGQAGVLFLHDGDISEVCPASAGRADEVPPRPLLNATGERIETARMPAKADVTLNKAEDGPQPPSKKVKSGAMEQSPASEWPDAWLMPAGQCENQKAPNRRSPNVPVTANELKDLGICYWKLDASAYDYPKISVPWNPEDAVDPKLSGIRDDRGYSYADIITVHPDVLPEYDSKVESFFQEHIHDAEEIRYVLGGSGFFDVRNRRDEWVRVHVKAGDLMTLPEGIYHRFTVDEEDVIHAMRLFIGQPVWTPFNRPYGEDNHESRKKYVRFMEEREKEG